YLYLTRGYHSLHKLPYFANAFFGLKCFPILTDKITGSYPIPINWTGAGSILQKEVHTYSAFI
ncbi:MAG: hypothetical protein ACP5JP_02925, partial [bacterium]